MNRNDRQQQIAQLSQELSALSQRLEALILAEAAADNDNNNGPRPQRPQQVRQAQDFVIGDQVEITNNYRGQQGLRGTIVTVTPRTVALRLHGQNRVLTKRKENVRRIQAEAEQ